MIVDCDRFHQHLGAWLDGRADGRLLAGLRAHSVICDECRLLENTRRQLRDLVKAANSESALPRFVTSILEHNAKAKVRP